ncbi:putative ankyrin repeat protein RBE_0319 [Octopus sinensis]|uniref:Ankyrin repeat protein RBE_0319 n=1 Tax=Octopus sinensis TaxID=2607531 RepID=A0A7E6FUX8_9MOLL|nr:putative ankyrin repeat protein RBE_0319 [Octopus sinensis]
MKKVNIEFSPKDIPFHSKDEYIWLLIHRTNEFIQRIRWITYHHDTKPKEDPQLTHLNNRYKKIFRSRKSPPPNPLLENFEKDLLDLIVNIKFKEHPLRYNPHLRHLKDYIKSIQGKQDILVPADKTGNLYRMDYATYSKLIRKELNLRYKVTTKKNLRDINLEIKKVTANYDLTDRTEPLKPCEPRINLKDHKKIFSENPSAGYEQEITFLDIDNINLRNNEVNVNGLSNKESHTLNKHKSIEEKNLAYKPNYKNRNSKQIINKYENASLDKPDRHKNDIVHVFIAFQINKRNVNGDTPLLLACHRGNTEVIQQLLLYKPDVNLENKHNNTPLHWACSWGFKDIVEQLLLFDADVNRKDIYHYTPLHWACDSGHLEVVQQLLWWSKSCSESSLTKADVNAVDSDDVTALHVACGLGYENIIKELQIPELKVNAKDKKYENTPLHWACRSGHKQAVQQLLNSKPDVNLTNAEGNTPLHLAVLNQRYDVVAFLLSQPDVEVNTKNIKETTPLFDAVSLSHFGILQKLVSHGAELDALDADGNNCLHLAVKKDKFHSEEETGEHLDYFWKRLGLEKEEKLCGTVIACYLGRSKANFHQKNNSGKTPVDLIESDYQEKIKELFPPFCLLCGVKEVSVTLLPCGDKVICRKCYEENQPRDCPKCEKPIKNFTVPGKNAI